MKMIKVEATQAGYYNDRFVPAGNVISVPLHDVSDKWHKLVNPNSASREDILRARARVRAKATILKEGVRVKAEEEARFEAEFQAKIEKEEMERVRTEYAKELRTKTEKEAQAKAEKEARKQLEAERLAKEEAEVQARLEAEGGNGKG